jgi:hypothetical protein
MRGRIGWRLHAKLAASLDALNTGLSWVEYCFAQGGWLCSRGQDPSSIAFQFKITSQNIIFTLNPSNCPIYQMSMANLPK